MQKRLLRMRISGSGHDQLGAGYNLFCAMLVSYKSVPVQVHVIFRLFYYIFVEIRLCTVRYDRKVLNCFKLRRAPVSIHQSVTRRWVSTEKKTKS